jgi:hypothetical protein
MMDTKTLVVGQDVYVADSASRNFFQGKVTKVTPEGVEVLTSVSTLSRDVDESWIPMWFDSNGENGTDGHDGQDVYGFHPWHIDDMPFAERRGKKVTVTKTPDSV